MLTATMPKDIREYKEKLVAGFNARQLIASIIAIAVCVPIYLNGRKYLSEDMISWIVIFIAFPLGAIGFFKFNGMSAEKFVLCIIKHFIYPIKRVYKSSNCLREWQEQTKKEDLIRDGYAKTNGKIKILAQRYFYMASIERSVLLKEAEEQGILHKIKFEEMNKQLVTVKYKKAGQQKKIK